MGRAYMFPGNATFRRTASFLPLKCPTRGYTLLLFHKVRSIDNDESPSFEPNSSPSSRRKERCTKWLYSCFVRVTQRRCMLLCCVNGWFDVNTHAHIVQCINSKECCRSLCKSNRLIIWEQLALASYYLNINAIIFSVGESLQGLDTCTVHAYIFAWS